MWDQLRRRLLHHDLADGLALLEEVGAALLELLAGDFELDALAVEVVDEGGRGAAGELDLRGEGAVVEVLVALEIEQRVFAVDLVEFVGDPVDDDIVPILAAEAVVAVAGDHADVVILDAHDRDVEGAAAEIEDEDRLVGIELVEAVGERGGGRLVDDLEDVEAGELPGVEGGGALGVVEIGRNGDDGVGDLRAEVFLGVVLELLDDDRGELLGGIDVLVELAVKLALALAHLALDEIDDFFRLGDGVLLGVGADDGVVRRRRG